MFISIILCVCVWLLWINLAYVLKAWERFSFDSPWCCPKYLCILNLNQLKSSQVRWPCAIFAAGGQWQKHFAIAWFASLLLSPSPCLRHLLHLLFSFLPSFYHNINQTATSVWPWWLVACCLMPLTSDCRKY